MRGKTVTQKAIGTLGTTTPDPLAQASARAALEEIQSIWRAGRFFQVVWELKILLWGLIATAVAYPITYWLYARSIM